jgi:hypothetical protein
MDTLSQSASKNDVVAEVIDKVLTQVFGKEATALIYKHMERNYSVKYSEISDNIELFARGLEDFLRSGAEIIERKILEDISLNSRKLRDLQFESADDFDFVTQMKSFVTKS